MCVIFLYANAKPNKNGYKLIVASNRDEYFQRPTKAAHKWSGHNVYGGMDMEAGREGGTWLAIGGKDGIIKLGALLNLTGEPMVPNCKSNNNIICTADALHLFHSNNLIKDNNKNSSFQFGHYYSLLGRGMLTTDYVTSFKTEHNIQQYNKTLLKNSKKYTGFNFLSIELSVNSDNAEICMCSNVPAGLTTYEQGKCYGFGNSLPSVPLEKVKYGQELFQKIVNDFEEKSRQIPQNNNELRMELVENLNSLLKNRKKNWPDAELKRRAPNLGELLSAINCYAPAALYGTRTHTIILVDDNDCLYFYESTLNGLNPLQDIWQQTYFQKCNFSQS